MRPMLAPALVLALCTSVVHADLRYTTRVDVRRIASATAGPVPGELAEAFRALMSAGETRIFVRDDAMRVEQVINATPAVALIRPDGQFVLYPDSRTYVRAPLPGGAAPGRTSTPALRRTGEFAALLGVRAERVFVTMTLALPITPPAGFPTTMTLEGEIWLANGYAAHAGGLRKLLGPVAGLPGGMEGMVLRQVLRIAQLGYEVETQVIELVEGPIDAALFEIPAGYRAVDNPITSGDPSSVRR